MIGGAFLLCLLLLPTTLSSTNQSSVLRLRITEDGLNYTASIAQLLLADLLPTIIFPTISANIDGGPGHGVVTITSMSIDASTIESPQFDYRLAPPHALDWSSTGGYVRIDGTWSAWYMILAKVYLSGRMSAIASGISLELNTSVAVLAGRPQLRVYDCSAALDHLSISIDGGILQWIVNLFRTPIANRIRAAIHDQLCISVRTVFVDDVNRLLAKLPTHTSIGDDFYLDYWLHDAPNVTDEYIQSEAFAAVQRGSATCQIPPPGQDALPTADVERGRMLHLWASDWIGNCLLDSMHNTGALSLLVDYRHVPMRLAQFLRTSCIFPCIGELIPQIGLRYPNRYIDIVLSSSQAPSIIVGVNGTEADVDLNANLYLSPWNASSVLLVQFEIHLNASIELYFADTRLCGSLLIDNLDIVAQHSSVGNVSAPALHTIASALKPLLQLTINAILERGIRVPIIDGITLAANTTQLHLLHRAIRIDANLLYL